MSRFGGTLSKAQMDLARKFERAGLCSLSQAVKAFERGENAKIRQWRSALQAREEVQKLRDAGVDFLR